MQFLFIASTIDMAACNCYLISVRKSRYILKDNPLNVPCQGKPDARIKLRHPHPALSRQSNPTEGGLPKAGQEMGFDVRFQ